MREESYGNRAVVGTDPRVECPVPLSLIAG